MNNLFGSTNALAKMKSGKELIEALTILPEYDPEICNADISMRLAALSDLYRIYIPSKMSLEIYSRLYLAMLRSLQKKGTKLAVKQKNQNYKAIIGQEYDGIMGGSDSFTIIGISGIGKSSAVSRAVTLITNNQIIETEEPYNQIVPCITVQCPFDSSVKGLLLEILRKVDEVLETNYYQNTIRARATTDMLIGSVSQVALNHIGMIIVDEIQNVVNSKNGKSLIGSLTQLINNSGISICMVGTPECVQFFEAAMQLARRSVGLRYTSPAYDDYFAGFCKTMYGYQYLKHRTEINDGIIEWLYEHSAGVISVVVSLIHDAQEIAILNGKEILDLETLSEAYQQRLSLLHGYIKPISKQKSKYNKNVSFELSTVTNRESPLNTVTITELSERSKKEKRDIVELLSEHFTVEVIKV